jgi:L-seryl-tRNA(Ser) seleniumtransferase
MDKKKTLLRSLPKVDECLNRILLQLTDNVPQFVVKKCVQKCIEQERLAILDNPDRLTIKAEEEWDRLFLDTIHEKYDYNLKCIYNCTGVVIHTNLGRSLLPQDAMQQLLRAGSNYSNLEFNLITGKRGIRYSLVEEIICDLTGAEAALVVNNNAAAVMLALDTFAKGKEVIVSRGQLVEIGGSFRIPDVMAKSGARLVEVGATNRTHYKDYNGAITDETAMLLRVHTSNFKIIGFTSDVSPEEMVQLGQEHNLITMEDLGSGSLIDLSHFGLEKEPTVQEVVKAGIDVVTFSGDKLLGGPQAGIIVGNKDIIDKIKKNPMNRALRIDKFTLASLEAVLRIYYDIPKALQQIPTLRMLTIDSGELQKRARRIARRIRKAVSTKCDVQVLPVESKVGGGAMPDCNLPSYGVILMPHDKSIHDLEKSFRKLEVPIIGRVENEQYVLDVRTIQDGDVVALSNAIISFFS